MHIRPFTPADIPSIIDIQTYFHDKDLLAWLCPRRQEYPISWRELHAHITKRQVLLPESHGIVCVIPASSASSTKEEIVGFAFWRTGHTTTKPELAWHRSNTSMAAKLERMLWKAEGAYNDLLHLNAATDYARAAILAAVRPDKQILPKHVLPEYWHLGALGVAPQHERKGVGSLLLQWGLDVARAEGVPVALRATIKGEGLYRRHGFKTVARDPAWTALGIRGGYIMVFDPRREWIRDASNEERRVVVEGVECEVEAVWTEKALANTTIEALR